MDFYQSRDFSDKKELRIFSSENEKKSYIIFINIYKYLYEKIKNLKSVKKWIFYGLNCGKTKNKMQKSELFKSNEN